MAFGGHNVPDVSDEQYPGKTRAHSCEIFAKASIGIVLSIVPTHFLDCKNAEYSHAYVGFVTTCRWPHHDKRTHIPLTYDVRKIAPRLSCAMQTP